MFQSLLSWIAFTDLDNDVLAWAEGRRFQSLLSWIAFTDTVGAAVGGDDDGLEFQSLLSWIAFTDIDGPLRRTLELTLFQSLLSWIAFTDPDVAVHGPNLLYSGS